MDIKTNNRLFVCGKTGSGKTVFVKNILLPLYPRKVFWDIKIENNDLLTKTQYDILDFDQHKDGFILCRKPTHLLELLNSGHTSILYQPMDIDKEDFDAVCEVIFNFGNTCLIVDEVNSGEICTPHEIQKWHKEIMIRGRSRGVGIINITQRPRMVHNSIISEAEHFYIFRLQLDTDIVKLNNVIPKEYVKEVANLPNFHFIYSNAESTELCQPIEYVEPTLKSNSKLIEPVTLKDDDDWFF